jgi:acyl-CoA thioester hydrolase
MPETGNPLVLRVYWEDTDAGGVVFYANYLKYFERARTEWLRRCGIEQSKLQEQLGAIFVVAEVNIRYLASARLDDLLSVTVDVLEQGKASLLFEQKVLRATEVLAQGRVRVGCVDAHSLKPRRIPESVHRLLPLGDFNRLKNSPAE